MFTDPWGGRAERGPKPRGPHPRGAHRPGAVPHTRPHRPVPASGGIVYLVGAGPGAADLLTVRAARVLGQADVVVHDRLVSEDVLALARPDADRVFVGKSRANHCVPQHEINALLVRLGRAGKCVVRLKGGDPLVFGRGGEEAEALAAAGIACEIVPGITAALACAADAGIPLTHRDASRAVTLATGHTKDGTLDLDFAALARPGATLAIYMGVQTLPLLLAGLTRHGFDPATPAALVERGGTPRCRVLDGTLPELVARASHWCTDGPVLVLIGAVVGRRVTRSRPAAEAPAALSFPLSNHGGPHVA